jgi:hypothetical protein
MSYDLCSFVPPPGRDPAAAGRALCEGVDDGAPRPGPSLGGSETLRRIAEAIAAADPTLTAEPHGRGTPDAFVDLSGPEEGNGLQIVVFDDTVFVHLPYWHTGDDARAAWEQAWRCLQVVEREGYRTYDPQLERMIDLRTDLDEVLASYAAGVAATDQAIASAPPPPAPPSRPWWKLWR